MIRMMEDSINHPNILLNGSILQTIFVFQITPHQAIHTSFWTKSNGDAKHLTSSCNRLASDRNVLSCP